MIAADRLRLIASEICKFANGSCTCHEKDRKTFCQGPMDRAQTVMRIAVPESAPKMVPAAKRRK